LPKRLRVQTLAQSPLLFIAPAFPCSVSELATADPLDWSQLPLIVSERGLARQQVDVWCRTNAIKPNIYAQVSGHEAIVSMVGLGFGVGVVPELVLANSPQRATIRVLDVQPALAPFPLVKAFWDVARSSNPAAF
jgi:LysR family positive regulator for ilvC